jgi:hypothetical protein
MSDIVGKYKGIKVYRVSLPEYVNGRLYKDEDNIYLIDGELIYKNEIFAKYDGNYVTEYDLHERATYYTVPAIKMESRDVEFSSSTGTARGSTNSNFEMKTSGAGAPATVEETLAGVFDTDYFSGMTDIDAFLKSNS